jgi:hypothetical protein
MSISSTIDRHLMSYGTGDPVEVWHALRPLISRATRVARHGARQLEHHVVAPAAERLWKHVTELRRKAKFERDVRAEMIRQQRVHRAALDLLEQERNRRAAAQRATDRHSHREEARRRAEAQATREKTWERRRVRVSEHTKADGTRVKRYAQDRMMRVNRSGEVTLEFS